MVEVPKEPAPLLLSDDVPFFHFQVDLGLGAGRLDIVGNEDLVNPAREEVWSVNESKAPLQHL